MRTWERIASDYERAPTKPVLDSEPLYENHPICFQPQTRGFSDDDDTRFFAYADVFAGAFGHTYGHHSIWQMHGPERGGGVNFPQNFWYEAINEVGSEQMTHLRRLMESRPFRSRVPDQSLVASDLTCGGSHVQATRDADGSYAMLYSSLGEPFDVELSQLSGRLLVAHWFDPRSGEVTRQLGAHRPDGVASFVPPSSGPGEDWVLILDDRSRRYPLPGPVVDTIRPPRGNGGGGEVGPIGETPEPGALYRAVNFNGPELDVDGVTFEAELDALGVCASGPRFENQDVPLDPPTEPERAQMIRSSVDNASVEVQRVPPGAYDVYLHVWEDNDSADYTLFVDSEPVAEITSGPAGNWERLGPFRSEATDGAISITTTGGDANLSGLELYGAEDPAG